jgi:hypothetical protein
LSKGILLLSKSLRHLLTLFLYFLILFSYPLLAQTDSITLQKVSRADYIHDISDKLNISVFTFKNANDMTLSGRTTLNYKPNDYAGIGFGLRLYWLGIAFSYAPKNIQDKTKGNTTYTSIKLNSYGKKIGFDLYYLNYSGYYLGNSNNFPELSLPKKQEYIRSDLRTLNIGANVYYIFNHQKYSYRSTFIQNEIQRRSAGSFMLSASMNYYQIKDDSSIIPKKLNPSLFNDEARIEHGDFYNLSLMPGYGHTFVAFERLFLTISAFGGLNFQQQHYLSQSRSGERFNDNFVVIPRAMARAGVGFNSKKFYCGAHIFLDIYSLPLGKKEKLEYTNDAINLYFGYHISLPQSWHKALRKYRYLPYINVQEGG